MKNPLLLVLGVSLAGFLGWGGVRVIRRGRERRRQARDQAARWLSADGRVVSVEVKSITSSSYNAATHTAMNSTTHYPNVTFAFDVGGRTFTMTQILSRMSSGNSKKLAKSIEERLQPGTRLPVFYDPDDPSSCTLQRAKGGMGEAVVGAAIVLLALLFLAMAVFGNV